MFVQDFGSVLWFVCLFEVFDDVFVVVGVVFLDVCVLLCQLCSCCVGVVLVLCVMILRCLLMSDEWIWGLCWLFDAGMKRMGWMGLW